MAMKQSRLNQANRHGNSAGNGQRGGGLNGRNHGSQNNNNLQDGNGHAMAGLLNEQVAGIPQAKAMTELLMSLMRDIFAVDDQAAELPLRQLRVCAMLYEGARSMSSLSRELSVSLSAMTQIADRLERARLVKRSFEGTDRRVRCLQLTPRAQRIMRLREDSRVQRASAALEQLPLQQRANVLTTLQALHTACSATMSNGNGSTTDESGNHAIKGNGSSGSKL